MKNSKNNNIMGFSFMYRTRAIIGRSHLQAADFELKK